MNPKDARPGPIRHRQFSVEVALRIDKIRETLADVCDLTEDQWWDAFRRDASPEQELLWWERVCNCYLALIAGRAFSRDQQKSVFLIVYGLFIGIDTKQLEAELDKLNRNRLSRPLRIS